MVAMEFYGILRDRCRRLASDTPFKTPQQVEKAYRGLIDGQLQLFNKIYANPLKGRRFLIAAQNPLWLA